MSQKCRWATAHWVRFKNIETPDTLDLAARPVGAASWMIWPDGPVGENGSRLPSNVWCGVAQYHERACADAAIDSPSAFLPFLPQALESWHALLLPIAHRASAITLIGAIPERCSRSRAMILGVRSLS
jgi:hypothetical protein